MFKNHFPQKVDSKARVSIPAPYRRLLEKGDPDFPENSRPRVVIVYGDDDRNWLECYTIKGMRRIEKRIAKMKDGDRARNFLTHNIVTMSQEIEIDDEGRIVLPPPAREKIGLANLKESVEAVFAGTLNTFRIWHHADWVADRARQKAVASALLAPGEDMMSLLPPDDEDETED